MTDSKLLRANFLRRDATGGVQSIVVQDKQEDVIRHAIDAYSFLLPVDQTLTLPEFADLIEENYVPTVPQIGEILRVLHSHPPIFFKPLEEIKP